MRLFPRAAITSYHKLDGLKQQNLFSHSSAARKFKINVPAGRCSLWKLQGIILPFLPSSQLLQVFLGLWKHSPELCLLLHVTPPGCLCIFLLLFFSQGPWSLDLGPNSGGSHLEIFTLIPSANKHPYSKQGHIHTYQGLGLQDIVQKATIPPTRVLL